MPTIKRLKLKGFKSFAEETTLHFENGFNTIVGANGSGKSNVFDALCFVLGRISSKGLRTEKLGHLVFNGGSNLKRSKEAQVSIFLDNSKRELSKDEIDEVKISRVVSKVGKSNYYLNNNKSTRSEIVEMLKKCFINPDGYNIILQGDITKIVNMTNVERRELIEEISDISQYEDKRSDSLKKLDNINIDFEQADILMREKLKYITELKSEKKAAEEFSQTKDDFRKNSLLLIKSKTKKNIDLIQNKKKEYEVNEIKVEQTKVKISKVLDENQLLKDEIEKLNTKIERQTRGDFTKTASDISSLKEKIQNSKYLISSYEKSLNEQKTRQNEVKKNIFNLDDDFKKTQKEKEIVEKDISKINKELEAINNSLQKLKDENSDISFDKLDKIEEELQDLLDQKESKTNMKNTNLVEIEKLNSRLEIIEEQKQKIENLEKENKENVVLLNSSKNELKKLVLTLTTNMSKNNEIRAKLNSLKKEKEELEKNYSHLNSKISYAKDRIMQNKSVSEIKNLKNSKIYGVISELISTKQKFETAIETIAKASLFNIVVEDDKTAVDCINHLKNNRIGNATFMPLNKVKPNNFVLDNKILKQKGVVDFAINLVDYDKKYENIMKFIFSDFLIIENIEYSKSIGIGKYKMVSLDGDLSLKTGVLRGGFKSQNKKIASFALKEETFKLNEISTKIETINKTTQILNEDLDKCENDIYVDKNKKVELETKILKLEKILNIEDTSKEDLESKAKAILSDKKILENSLKNSQKSLDEIMRKIDMKKKERESEKENTRPQKAKELTSIQNKKDELSNLLNSKQIELSNLNIKTDNIFKNEKISLSKIMDQTTSQIDNLKIQISENKNLLKANMVDLNDLEKKEKELSKGYEGLIEKRDLLNNRVKSKEGKIDEVNEKFEKEKERSQRIKFQIEEYENFEKNLKEEEELFYEEIKTDMVNDKSKNEELLNFIEKSLKKQIDLKELQNKVNTLKVKLNSFGNINLKAVEIYDKLKEEFDILVNKRQKLTEEKDEILGFISEMDKLKKEKFLETYNKLRENFEEIFSQISSKGKVELLIENEKDLFNSGVDIKVKLSQKNYLDLKSLSGGEKTLTAIAFIFAVQEFEPAPFYIFDEVDAALDILNCELLGKLVAKYSKNAQYIVVSHSEHFIQSSKTIFGVSMNKNKISNVVSLDLKNAANYTEE